MRFHGEIFAPLGGEAWPDDEILGPSDADFADALLFSGDPRRNLWTVRRTIEAPEVIGGEFEEFVRLVSPHRDVLRKGLLALLATLGRVAEAQMEGTEALTRLSDDPDIPEWVRADIEALAGPQRAASRGPARRSEIASISLSQQIDAIRAGRIWLDRMRGSEAERYRSAAMRGNVKSDEAALWETFGATVEEIALFIAPAEAPSLVALAGAARDRVLPEESALLKLYEELGGVYDGDVGRSVEDMLDALSALKEDG